MPEPFGDRFINLMDVGFAAGGNDLGARVRLALDGAPPGGPLTVYLSAQLELSASLELDERCLWFMGPGASVTLRRGARFDVLGAVDLGFEPRFRIEGSARVRLLGPLEVIRPEWWIGSVDEQLQLAVELAAERARQRREAVPVRLTGPYVLRYALDLTRAAAGSPIAFEFQGRHPVGDPVLESTLIRGPEMSSTEPLVFAQDVGPVRFEHVAFDTTASDERELDSLAPAPAVDAWRGTEALDFVRCSFFGVKGLAVATSAPGDPRRITVRECWFQVGTALKSGHFGVRCTGDSRLRLDGCTFVGRAHAMVEVISGMLDVIGCQFDNQASSTEGGADIRVTDPAPAFRIIKNGGPFKITEGDASRLAGPEVTVGWVQINVIHARTRSRRHLVSSPVMRPTTVALTGVVQELPADDTVMADPPSAIEWRAPLTSAMLLQGCYFTGAIDVPRPGYVLAVGARLEGTPATLGGTHIPWRYPQA